MVDCILGEQRDHGSSRGIGDCGDAKDGDDRDGKANIFGFLIFDPATATASAGGNGAADGNP